MKTRLIFIVLLGWVCAGTLAQNRKMVAIGSSTTAGLRADPPDSAWVNRFDHYYKHQLGVLDATYNLGVAGNTLFSAMPSSYVNDINFVSPDPAVNVTKANNLLKDLTVPSNGVVIINFPSNGYDYLATKDILNALQIMYDSVTGAGYTCFITTTQPRTGGNFGLPSIKKKLAVIKDSIIERFGVHHTLNFWDGMYNPADTSILPLYAAGDGIHFNNAGHKVLFQRVVAKNVFGLKFIVTETEHPITPELTMFPNPVHDRLFLTTTQPVDAIYIVNTIGEIIDDVRLTSSHTETTGVVDFQDRPPGLYFIKTVVDNRSVTRKFIKE